LIDANDYKSRGLMLCFEEQTLKLPKPQYYCQFIID